MASVQPKKSIVAADIMARRLVKLHPEMDVFKGIEILVKNKISEKSIDAAVSNLPPEVYNISGVEIAAKLKSRRTDRIRQSPPNRSATSPQRMHPKAKTKMP